MSSLEGYYIKKIGQHRGKPRVWIDRTQTEKAGLAPGDKYDIVVKGQTIVLQANKDGTRIVTPKKEGERVNPIIDLQSEELKALFDGMSAVRVAVKKGEIYLVPLASELKKQDRVRRLRGKLDNGEPLAMGSLSHGAGIMAHAIHTGLNNAGVPSQLAFVNEIRPELVEHAYEHNDAWSKDTKIFAAPMQEVAFDQRALANVPPLEILEAGIPCSAASLAGRAKKSLVHPEADKDVGHLVVSALMIVNQANPAVVVIENVPSYATSASADILRTQLKELGYTTHERECSGSEWGALENRSRWFMVAVTEGISFDFEQLIPPQVQPRRVRDVLDPSIGADDERWRPYQYLRDKEARDISAGKGFMMQIIDADSEAVPTLRKFYSKGGSTDPLIQHPTNPDLFRKFTTEEHAALKNIPIHLVGDASETLGHELLGQSVIYDNVKDIGEHVGNAINRFAGRPESALAARGGIALVAKASDLPIEAIDLAKEVVATLKLADADRGRYTGQIVAMNKEMVIQETGRQEGVVHLRGSLDKVPLLGDAVKVVYERGHAKVCEKQRKSQLALEI